MHVIFTVLDTSSFFFYKSDHNTYFPAKVLAEGKLCDRFPSSKEVREKEEVRKEEEWGGKEGEREKKEEELKKKLYEF